MQKPLRCAARSLSDRWRWRTQPRLPCSRPSTFPVRDICSCIALDNLPQEVSHILREIEIKDGKVQGTYAATYAEWLSRISSKESQMRDMFGTYMDKTNENSEAVRTKLDKMAARVAADYTRVEEWSAQKRELAHVLWRKVYAHHQRLVEDLQLINSDLVASVSSSVPKLPPLTDPAQLPAQLLQAGIGEAETEGHEGRVRKKRGLATTGRGRSVHSPPTAVETESRGVSEAAALDGEEERDENLYCFCQRPSFGEMIGCDSDDCKFEWFHIGCVGVSKPLPQMWVCSDCLAKKKRRRT